METVNRFRTVLFDLDGTLVDQFAAIHRTHVETRAHFGLSAPTPDEVRRAIGGGLEHALSKIWHGEHEELIPEAVVVYRQLWPKNIYYELKLMPGARELLEALRARGVQSAVLTNKHAPSAREIMAHLGVKEFFSGIFGSGDTEWLKPQIEFTQFVLKKLGADVATSCLIGDSTYDVETGKNAKLKTFCVTTGTHSAEELKEVNADGVFANLTELGRAELGV
jgi:phosphoglycolate phosphatase